MFRKELLRSISMLLVSDPVVLRNRSNSSNGHARKTNSPTLPSSSRRRASKGCAAWQIKRFGCLEGSTSQTPAAASVPTGQGRVPGDHSSVRDRTPAGWRVNDTDNISGPRPAPSPLGSYVLSALDPGRDLDSSVYRTRCVEHDAR